MSERYEIKKSQNNQFYFVLKAPNNEVIATSEMYATKEACKDGIDSVRKYGSTGNVDDKT